MFPEITELEIPFVRWPQKAVSLNYFVSYDPQKASLLYYYKIVLKDQYVLPLLQGSPKNRLT